MKTTVDFSDFREAFRNYDRDTSYTREGLMMLFEYFEELEGDIGEEIELDVIAICCEYSEDNPDDIITNYSIDVEGMDDDEKIEAVRDYLIENTQLVGETSTGFVYLAF